MVPDYFEELPAVERFAIARHALLGIDAVRLSATIRWLIPIGESALKVPKASSNSDTDHDLYLRDAIELAYGELPLIERDPYYARSSGDLVIDRLVSMIANVIGLPLSHQFSSDHLCDLARKALK